VSIDVNMIYCECALRGSSWIFIQCGRCEFLQDTLLL